MRPVPRDPRTRKGEQGHLMAGLMAALAIMLILSTMAFQAWEDILQRDNEAEMIFRAEELVRAIQRYRKDHGGLGPEKLEDLMEEGPKGQYYLRHLYDDPLVADGIWGLLYIGPGGAIIDPNAPEGAGVNGPAGSGAGVPGLQPQGGLGRTSLSDRLQEKAGAGSSIGGRPGLQPGTQPGSNSRLGTPGQGQVAGLRIAGVRTLSEEKPFRVRKGLTEYSQWMFTYLDLETPQVPGQNNPGAGRRGQRGPGVGPGGRNQPRGAAPNVRPGTRGGRPNSR